MQNVILHFQSENDFVEILKYFVFNNCKMEREELKIIGNPHSLEIEVAVNHFNAKLIYH